MTTFGEYLRSVRRLKGVSQHELAQRIGVTHTYLSKIENDRMAAPSEETLEKIARELEIDRIALFAVAGRVPASQQEFLTRRHGMLYLLSKMERLSDPDLEEVTRLVMSKLQPT